MMHHTTTHSEDIVCRAHVQVLHPSNTAVFLFIVYLICIFLVTLALFNFGVSPNTPEVLTFSVSVLPILEMTVDAGGLSNVVLHKDYVLILGAIIAMLSAFPPVLFLLFRRFYKNELEMTTSCIFIYKRDFRTGIQNISQIPIEQLDSVVIKNELLTNGSQLILRSSRGNRVRLHCVTNASDVARTAMHFYQKYTGRRDILKDSRSDPDESRSHRTGGSSSSEHRRSHGSSQSRDHAHAHRSSSQRK